MTSHFKQTLKIHLLVVSLPGQFNDLVQQVVPLYYAISDTAKSRTGISISHVVNCLAFVSVTFQWDRLAVFSVSTL